jgi:hypothetical protein
MRLDENGVVISKFQGKKSVSIPAAVIQPGQAQARRPNASRPPIAKPIALPFDHPVDMWRFSVCSYLHQFCHP